MDHHEKLWDTMQDDESDCRHTSTSSAQVLTEAEHQTVVQQRCVRDVRILILTGPGLDNE